MDAESDGHLIALVRGGDMSAFDDLYERHLAIAGTVAKRNVDNPSDAEDVVAEAFQSVLQSLVAGKGPDTFFRAYLLSTVTRLSHQRNRKAGKVLPSSDESVLDQTLADSDSAVSAFESRTVAKAFRALPERWQAVLWYLDVERMKPAAVAPILGLSANAVSALALRAREGLRRHYLQFHIADQPDEGCAEFVTKLGTFIRGGLSSATERKVRGHLKGCSKCTAALAELKDVQGSMRVVLLPLVTGVPLASWVAQGGGLGAIGGVIPAKAVLAVPALAKPAVMAVIAAAGVGLVLGAVGVVDQLTPDAYMEERAVESRAPHADNERVVTPTEPTQTTAPAPVSPAVTPPPPVAAAPPAPVPEPSPDPVVTSTPVPTPAPTTPAPLPSTAPSPQRPVTISGTARRTSDSYNRGSDMAIDFTASGTRPLSAGTAVFSVGKDSRIVESSLRAPDGWSCSMEGRTEVTCVTETIQRSDLHFHVTVESRRQKDGGVLKYSLSGSGLTPGEFTYLY
ncbi:RNA polymerase sigma factor (sigma-70 family) [Paenarthrobacter nitroguajacolicus]|uniref:sigma-70 family RNA polymerase sigma factor n=1 Tax=Paenarthrobacter TaxID=1742992 RepID=UPI002857E4A1|nr:sigma-70 family RNA polymerase sigma factor [Paenarthrobacter nitroguajacolicus]MDR6986417.1 RNA polymerase sigma factor (sigma-70 family) [Paenarthrobacter nitroguajacolicus]